MTDQPTIRDRSDYKEAMKDLLQVDPARTAVLTIDMQADYLDTEHGTSPVSAADSARVLTSTAALLEGARSQGIPVIHVYVVRRAIEVRRSLMLPSFGQTSQRAGLSQNAQAPARTGPNRVEGTPQAEVPEQLVAPGDLHIRNKRVSDAYYDTELEYLLRRVFDVDTVVLTGINTDTCVYATTFATSVRGFRPVVVSDCVASMRGPDHHWMALELMSRSIAWVLTVDELLDKAGARPVVSAR